MTSLDFYTASSLNAGLQCPTLFKYKYIDLYRTPPSPAMFTGSTMHKGLEGFFLGKSFEESCAMMEDYAKSESDGWIEENQANWEKLKIYLHGYFKKWPQDFLKGKIVFVEQEFRFTYNKLEFGGKWDAVVYDPVEMTAIIYEHKTTSLNLDSEADSYFAKLPLDVQCNIYREAAWKFLTLNEHPLIEMPGLVYDVIKTTKAAPKTKKRIVRRKDETDEDLALRKEESMETFQEFGERISEDYMVVEDNKKYFQHEIPYVQSNHKRRLFELSEYANLLSNKGFLEIRNSTSCGNYGGCPYMDVCLGRERLDDSLKFTKLEKRHPELSSSEK